MRTLSLPLEPLFILHTLHQQGFEGYIVGGAVRDLLRSQNPDQALITDYDFTTNAKPEELQSLFPESFYENQFGTVSITKEHLWEILELPIDQMPVPPTAQSSTKLIDLNEATKLHQSLQTLPSYPLPTPQWRAYEITTFRSDGSYLDHRRPETVTWGKTLSDDLSRRDFTINSMALKIDEKWLAELFAKKAEWSKNPNNILAIPELSIELIDPFDGQKDLEDGVIRTVGEPVKRFEEDALRMLRAIRFSVQLNMAMTDETFAAISGLAEQVQHVSWERIRDEFLKMISSPYPAEAIELLDESGLLHFILPELKEGKGVEQGGHHTTDVWQHSLDALATCPSQDPVVRFATLLHDVAKPRTYNFINGQPTFHNHEIIGSRMAKDIAVRFRFSKQDIERVFLLVRYHMFYYQPHNTDAAIRRFMRKVGLENINDILDLREADRLGSGARKTSWRLEEMKERMISQLHQPFAVTDLAINGNDLMQEFQLKPGRVIGQVLQTLFEKVLEQPELNTRDQLLSLAKTLISEFSSGASAGHHPTAAAEAQQ